MSKKTSRIRFSIGLKLSIIVTIILALSISLITVLMAFFVGADVRLTAENNNWIMNRWSASAAANILNANKDKSLFLIRSIDAASANRTSFDIDMFVSRFFRLNPDIYSVAFIGLEGSPSGMLVNERFASEIINMEASEFRSTLFQWLQGRELELEDASRSQTMLFNAALDLDFPCLVMFFPLPGTQGFNFFGTGIVFFSADPLEESLRQSETTDNEHITFMVNNSAKALVYPQDLDLDFDNNVFAVQALATDLNALQRVFVSDELRYFGAFHRLSDMDLALITQIRSDLIDRKVNIEIIRISIIGAIVMLLSVFIIRRFAKTITVPLKALISGVKAIESGNYEPDLTIKSSDEIGALTSSFMAMGLGLANFERFTNKQLVELARKEQLSRSGVMRKVTICFTMIQNFKDLTRDMDPQHLIDFVNKLLASLVPCVTKTNGLVDKFLTQQGLVIMSLWGAAKSTGSPVSDAVNCIQTTLNMRNALRLLNLERLSGGEPGVIIKMGCGINSGEVVAGQMGSEERMEYTVIGDAVNVAARIQEPNELFNSDILISENTWDLINRYIVCEEMPPIEVKGKSEALRVFSVVNIKNYFGPSTMEEVRQLWRM